VRGWDDENLISSSYPLTFIYKYCAPPDLTGRSFLTSHLSPLPTFHEQERLKSRKRIGRLFKEGQSFVAYPMRVMWMPVEAGVFPAQVAIAVPKRLYKTAVARNRLKRQMREAYRLNKESLYEKLNGSSRRIVLMVVYIAKEAVPFREVESGMRKLVRKI
jgi:ribonuclease P protein component